MRIVFLGTPSFAVPILKELYAAHEVVAVVTQPDRRQGRKSKLVPSPVKEAAVELDLPVLQYERIRNAEAIEELKSYQPDIMVTAAYGQILSKENLEIAPLGVVNAHASLLPAYRGPAPVNWCLINGEKETGVTIMHTDTGVDTGDIIISKAVAIQDEETTETLLNRLSLLAGPLMINALALLEKGQAPRVKQDPEKASRHPMLKKEDGMLNFSLSAESVRNRARGVIPWPGPTARIQGSVWKMAELSVVPMNGEPGSILKASPDEGFIVACGTGAVKIGKLQRPGGKMLNYKDFLRGVKIEPGMRFDC